MKTVANAIWDSAFHASPPALVSRLTPANLVAPCYHIVSNQPPAHVRHLYECRTIRQFETELDWLLKRFHPISLEDLAARVAAHEPLPARSVFISFDDGLRECYETVAPICRAKGVPATFFLPTAFIDNRLLGYRHKASLLLDAYQRGGEGKRLSTREGIVTSFGQFRAFVLSVKYADALQLDECAEQLEVCFDEYLRIERPYLDDGEIAALIGQGFTVGGHSVDHPPYPEISLDRQLDQTRECLRFLHAKFPLTVRSFAFSFLADGVSEQFIDETLSSQTADLVFYTGALRPDHDGRVIWRFGVESGEGSLAGTWRRDVARQQRDRVRSLLKSVVN